MSLLKRIIFCLYYKEGYFYISRNFRLQKVGNVEWLIENFGFGYTSNYVDEIIIILVKQEPTNSDYEDFFKNILKLRKNIFIPITLGGGIRNFKTSKKFFENGADKILINTLAYKKKEIAEEIASSFGAQAICVMIDYKENDKKYELYSNCGTFLEDVGFNEHIKNLNSISCGEIILNSIDNDGNAEGINMKILNEISTKINKPILIMGGAGKPEHLFQALKSKKISGVITANLFNFLGDGLKFARSYALNNKIPLARF